MWYGGPGFRQTTLRPSQKARICLYTENSCLVNCLCCVAAEWRELLGLSDYRSRIYYLNALLMGDKDIGKDTEQ